MEINVRAIFRNCIIGYGISSYVYTGLKTVVHEGAHKITSDLLRQNCSSHIEILSWVNGGGFHIYDMNCNQLSIIGKLIGLELTNALISIAGPISTLMLAVLFNKVAKDKDVALGLRFALATSSLYSSSHFLDYVISDLYDESVKNGDFSAFSKHSKISPDITFAASLIFGSILILQSLAIITRLYFVIVHKIVDEIVQSNSELTSVAVHND